MSAVCDVYVGIRSGSDIAFLGGLVNYVLSKDRWFHEYVTTYTNASMIIEEGFQDTEDQVRGRRLAIRPGHADHGHLARRVAIISRCQRANRLAH